MARTKIIATLGPSSGKREKLREMLRAGVDVLRLNFSHGEREELREWVEMARREAKALGVEVAILGDLMGPKIRLGELPEGTIEVKEGQKVVLSTALNPESGDLPVTLPSLHRVVKGGQTILINDGRVNLRVTEVTGERIHTEVVTGGELKSRKGINLPHTTLDESPVTEKDHRDVEFAVKELEIDMIALSFVQSSEDVATLRGALSELQSSIPIIAKIERRHALGELGAILDASDAVMVARGDLGVEVPFEHVPGLQKNIIREANIRAKPVITATEMLESMIQGFRPTRAEATDVANAILDGTDAVMLSGETAVGHDPALVVEVMDRIATVTEREMGDGPRCAMPKARPGETGRAISEAVANVAHELGADAVMCLTLSGTTARRISKHRPQAPVYAITPRIETVRALQLAWGVVPVHLPDLVPGGDRGFNVERALDVAISCLQEKGLLGRGKTLVCAAGLPFHRAGETNLIAVRTT